MTYTLNLELAFPSRKLAGAVKESLTPEMNEKHEHRSRISLKVKNSTLSLIINALDKRAFQASASSYVSLIAFMTALHESEGEMKKERA